MVSGLWLCLCGDGCKVFTVTFLYEALPNSTIYDEMSVILFGLFTLHVDILSLRLCKYVVLDVGSVVRRLRLCSAGAAAPPW